MLSSAATVSASLSVRDGHSAAAPIFNVFGLPPSTLSGLPYCNRKLTVMFKTTQAGVSFR